MDMSDSLETQLQKFNVTFRPYPAGAGSRIHDELWTVEGTCLRDALDKFYQKPDFNPEWRIVDIADSRETLREALIRTNCALHKALAGISQRDVDEIIAHNEKLLDAEAALAAAPQEQAGTLRGKLPTAQQLGAEPFTHDENCECPQPASAEAGAAREREADK